MHIKRLFVSQTASSKILSILVLFICISLLVTLFFEAQVYNWSAIAPYKTVFLKGWFTTCALSLISLILSLCIGFIVALMKQSSIVILRYIASLYIELIRGSPLLVQLLFFFYVIANAISWNNRYWVGIVTLSLFSGAYIAEIIRSGIESIKKSHTDSAKAIGLTTFQSYRFVIFPMALRQILPPLTGQFASIIKDSSLLSILGIYEFTYAAEQVSSVTYSTLESYFPLTVGYLILTLPISLLSKRLERKFKYEA